MDNQLQSHALPAELTPVEGTSWFLPPSQAPDPAAPEPLAANPISSAFPSTVTSHSMLGASWAQRRTYSLRLARNVQPWRAPTRHIALPLPRPAFQDGVERLFNFGNIVSRDHSRGPRYSTSISSVADKAVALLKERKVEEAATILAQFPEGESNEALVLEVVDRFMESAKGVRDLESLFSWLESFPDANSASSDMFHKVFDRLVNSGHDDPFLIRRFGLLCASKGYQDFVAVHVAPKVARHATDSEIVRWKEELLRAAAEFKGLQISTEGVLEEDGWDYELAPATMSQKSSILEQVETSLPAVLPAISPNDDMIFEEDGAEYIASSVSGDPRVARTRVEEAIDDLVREGRWGDAHRFLLEIQEVGIFPRLSTSTTAIRALLSLILSPTPPKRDLQATLITQYLDWLRALPPALPWNEAPFLKDIFEYVFTPDVRILSLARDTALVLASRGYAAAIGTRVMRMYYTHWHSTSDTAFVRRMEQKNAKFWEESSSDRAEEMSTQINLVLRSAAIRTLSSVGQFQRAVELLPDASEGYLAVYDTLLRGIRSAGPAVVAQYEAEVLSRMPAETMDLPDHITQFPDTSDLESLRNWLEDALHQDLPPPHPMLILKVIDAFAASDPPESVVLTDLLNKAMRAGHLHALAFLYAELVHYYRRGNYEGIVETVTDHFYLGYGIPRGVVERVSNLLKSQRENTSAYTEPTPSTYRFHHKPTLHNRSKIWPSTAICNMLWTVNANRTYGYTQLEQQYNILVKLLEEGRNSQPAPGSSIPALTMAARYANADAFIPFMKRLMLEKGAPKGAAIINDIVRLGLQPKVAHFSELAFSYAINGGRRPALTILSKLEANFDKMKKAKEEKEGRKVPYGSPQNVNTLPLVPDVHMYVYLAKAFVKTQRVKEAEDVLQRMAKNLGDEIEGNPHVRKVRRDLETLKDKLQRNEGQDVV